VNPFVTKQWFLDQYENLSKITHLTYKKAINLDVKLMTIKERERHLQLKTPPLTGRIRVFNEDGKWINTEPLYMDSLKDRDKLKPNNETLSLLLDRYEEKIEQLMAEKERLMAEKEQVKGDPELEKDKENHHTPPSLKENKQKTKRQRNNKKQDKMNKDKKKSNDKKKQKRKKKRKNKKKRE